MSKTLLAALGRSGSKAGRPAAQTRAANEDPNKPAGADDDEEVVATTEEEPVAEDDDDDVVAEADDPDAEGDDEDYIAAEEEDEDLMAASMRGAQRVLAIVGSPAGRANPDAALKAAGMHKLSAAEAIDMIGVVPKADSPKPSARQNRLNAKLSGKAKGLAPDAVGAKQSSSMSMNDRMAARNAAAFSKK